MTIPSRFIEQVGPKVVGFREEILASTGALGEVGGSGWVGFPAYGFVDLMMGNCGASSWKNFVFPNEAGEWVEVNPRMGKKHLSAILHLWNKGRYIRFIFIVVFFNFFLYLWLCMRSMWGARDDLWESVFSFYRLSFHQVTLGLNESGQACIASAFPHWDTLMVRNNKLVKSPNQTANTWRYLIQNK